MNGMLATLLAGGATVVSVVVALVLEFALLQVILGAVAKAKLEDESPVAGCQSPVAGCQSPVARCQSPVAGCQSPVAGCRLPVASRPLPVAGCQSPVARCPLPVSSFQLPRAPMPNWNNPVSPTETIPALARVARERM